MTFEVIRKNTAFSCNRAFCGAFRDGCMNTFDVTQNDFFKHLDITIFFWKCSSSSDSTGLSSGGSIFTWRIF